MKFPRDDRSRMTAELAIEVTLRYPLPWFSPGDLGLQEVLSPSPRLLGGVGFRGLAVARLGGWPSIAADPQRAATALRFMTFWALLGEEGGFPEAELLAAVRGSDGLPENIPPALRAWWDVARRCRAAMGPAWCGRLAEDFADWLDANRCEAHWRAKIEVDAPYPARQDLLPIRVASVGVAPAIDFLEYVSDCPLPLAVRSHPAHAAVRRYAARLVAVQDDLVGVAEDLASHRPNLLGCMLLHEGLSPAAAAAEVEALHDESLCGLTGASQLLRAEFPRVEAVTRWLRAVQTLCHGFARWHSMTPHERRTTYLPSGPGLAIEIEYV
ncbi:terpene synthase family protein [Nannocystis sp. RBIL2]|uniref:terpene synthase family protein n=1 Tax=Nannocystis sp. RBIL2 TaxID=2996788 RepID=UPI00226EA20F|nr:terpene synthase family protein [Nannocystis sp. RBIL2]MCY1069421.1 terpene synthase family protein [Nannocystis sp. RBIL2]